MANKGFFSPVLRPDMIESRIPKFFWEKNIQAPLPRIAMITVEGRPDRSWSIRVENKDGCFFFTKKWVEFMKDNDIKHGHILHFTWRGGGNFHGKIHRESEIHVLDHSSGSESDDGRAVAGGTEGGTCLKSAERGTTIVIGKQKPEHSKGLSANSEAKQGHVAEGSCNAQREERRGRPTKVCGYSYAAAKKFSSEPGNQPNFIASLNKTSITIGSLHVPQRFIKEHMGTILGYRKRYATLCDSRSKKTMEVEIKRVWNKAEYFYKIATGFGAFVHGCDLKELDVCVFKALTKECDKFEITVFREGKKV